MSSHIHQSSSSSSLFLAHLWTWAGCHRVKSMMSGDSPVCRADATRRYRIVSSRCSLRRRRAVRTENGHGWCARTLACWCLCRDRAADYTSSYLLSLPLATSRSSPVQLCTLYSASRLHLLHSSLTPTQRLSFPLCLPSTHPLLLSLHHTYTLDKSMNTRGWAEQDRQNKIQLPKCSRPEITEHLSYHWRINLTLVRHW